MRLLQTSDWHLDWVTFGISRFDEIDRAVQTTCETAVKEKCTDYFFTGDLCDPDSGPVVFRCVDLAIRAAMFLTYAGIRSHWLVGNHDVIEDGSGTSTLTPLRALGKTGFVTLYDQPTLDNRDDGVSILALPFTPTSHTYDPMVPVRDFLRTPGKGIVLSHLTCPGIIPGEETNDMPRGRDVLLPLVELAKRPNTLILQGHYHKPQSHDMLHIPGSLARLTFGEVENDPSFLIMDF